MPDQDTQPINPDLHWLEQLPAGVILIVGERLRYANAEALRLIRAAALHEVLGRSVQDFIHPLDLARVLARIRRAERGEAGNPPTEFRVYACDGSLRVLAMTSTPLRLGDSWAALATFMDLSARAEMDARLRETDDNFQRMMNTMQDVFYRTDADGITRYVCPAVRNVLGYSAEEIVGLPAAMFYPDPVEREPLLAAIRRDGFVHDFPGRMRRKDGRIIDIAISTQILRDEQGNYAGVEGIWRDITERKRMERELARLATRDDLTGILNRRALLEHLDTALQHLRRGGPPLSVLLLDLDHFKRVNDTWGHGAGDAALCQFVALIQTQLREIDQLGRLGGEEFVLVLEQSDHESAQAVAERIRRVVQDTPFVIDAGHAVQLTASLGLTAARVADRRASDVLERADRALYRAKAEGRNRVSA